MDEKWRGSARREAKVRTIIIIHFTMMNYRNLFWKLKGRENGGRGRGGEPSTSKWGAQEVKQYLTAEKVG